MVIKSEPTKLFVNSLLIGMIITGTLNTLVYKFQNTSVIDDVRFNHPYMQALCMFLGEACCIFLYWGINLKETESPDKKPPSYWILAIPAMFDGITSSLQHIALNFIPSSIYQMLRGGVIIVTAILSKIFLKKKLKKQQLAGIVLTLFGIFIVGLSNFLFQKQGNSSESKTFIEIVSIALVLLSLLSQGACYVSEEKIFETYNMHTFMMVGGEGIWGLLYFAILMPILNFTPCNFDDGCVFHDGKGYMERTDVFLQQLGADVWLTIAVVLGIISIALFNLFGVNVTKHVSAVARTVVDAVRTVLIWGIGLIVTLTTNKEWENISIYANLVELVGFAFLVFGNLVYKELIVLSILREQKVDPLVEKIDEDEGEGEKQVNISQN